MSPQKHDNARKHAGARPKAVIVSGDRRACGRETPCEPAYRCDVHRPAQLSPVPAAALSGGDGRTFPRRYRLAHPQHFRQRSQCARGVLGTVEGLDLEAREVIAGPLRLPSIISSWPPGPTILTSDGTSGLCKRRNSNALSMRPKSESGFCWPSSAPKWA